MKRLELIAALALTAAFASCGAKEKDAEVITCKLFAAFTAHDWTAMEA